MSFVYNIILAIITSVIDFIGTILITLTGSIVSYVFSFQSFVEVPIVQIGWQASRDLANMAFILIMLLIAFGTVLRWEQYGFKKLIPKLVVAALLINFSLIICGAIIDFGNSLALFFVSGGRPGESVDVAANLMGAMRAGAIAQLRNTITLESGVSTLLMVSVGQLIMYIIMAFTLLALAAVMIERIIRLWILIIFAPFAWVASAVPGKSGYFSKWWSDFFNMAVFFPVAISFFLFLGLLAGATFSSTGFESIANTKDLGGFWSTMLETTFSTIMQFLVVVSLLWMGLDQAGKAGKVGGKLVVNWAEGAKKWALGKGWKIAPKMGFGTAKRMADWAAGKAGRPGIATRGLAAGLGKLEKAPLIGRAIGGPGAAYVRQQAALKAAAGKFEKLRPVDIEARLKQTAFTPAGLTERASMIKALIDKGQFTIDLKDEFKDVWKNYLQTFQNMGGSMIDLIKKAPSLAYNPDIQKMIVRDPNAPPPVKEKWAKVQGEANEEERDKNIKNVLVEDVFKTAADFAGIRKEDLDLKGKLTTEKAKEYDHLEGQKDNLRDLFLAQEALAEAKESGKSAERIAELQASLNRLKGSLDGSIGALADLKRADQISKTQYLDGIKNLQQQQVAISGREGQQKLLGLFLNEFNKRDGKLYLGNLNAMASKNRDGHLNLLKYMKAHMPAMKDEMKEDVYKHVTGGLVANTMPDPTMPAPAPTP